MNENTQNTTQQREKEIDQVTLLGSLVNIILTVLKFGVGIAGRSSAMVADAIHSLSDLLTDVVVLIFVHIGSKPSDKKYDYGRGKFETLASALVGMLLLVVAGGILYHGAAQTYSWLKGNPLPKPGTIALWGAVASVILKEIIYRYTMAKSKKLHSPALEANAWHHRSDALSSVATLVGIGGAILLGERWSVLDPIASVVVGCFIVRVAWKLLGKNFRDLMEASLPEETEAEILSIVTSFPDVQDPHNLKTRRIGGHYAIEIHIRMDGKTSLLDSHSRAHDIEKALRERFGADTHITIHVEPVKPSEKH